MIPTLSHPATHWQWKTHLTDQYFWCRWACSNHLQHGSVTQIMRIFSSSAFVLTTLPITLFFWVAGRQGCVFEDQDRYYLSAGPFPGKGVAAELVHLLWRAPMWSLGLMFGMNVRVLLAVKQSGTCGWVCVVCKTKGVCVVCEVWDIVSNQNLYELKPICTQDSHRDF